MVNEPSSGLWPKEKFVPALQELDRRLRGAGFTPTIVAPSNAGTSDALNYAKAIMASNAAPLVDQIGYHRYGGATNANIRAVGALAAAHGISSAMTEHIGSGHLDLIEDLVDGRASTWSQFTLAYPTNDNGAQYYPIQGTSVRIGSRTRYLRQYFRHVRRGDVRVEATSREARVVPVAFHHGSRGMAVVMDVTSAGDIVVSGLRPGRYGIGFETDGTIDGVLPDVTVGASGATVVPMPDAGVVALYAKPGA
jgi:hypothetical protein